MVELKGKYNTAKVFTDIIEDSAKGQIIALMNQEFMQGSKIRIMPDCHAGAGCTIGTTMTVKDKAVPNLVGVDIGCGMHVTKFSDRHIELQKLDKVIRQYVPSGFSRRETPHLYADKIDLTELRCFKHIDANTAELSLGTLGGGNHFIELDKDAHGKFYLVIHSGSRHLGLEVANYYQEAGYNELNSVDKKELNRLIEDLKKQGRKREIESFIKTYKEEHQTNIPKILAYVQGSLLDDYIHDIKIVQRFAELNREAMAREIIKNMKLDAVDSFTTIHNYIDTDAMILRKGAVSAKEGERLIIPINMRDGSLICTGKGNDDWNQSAPHGAGRLMSRSEAKQSFTVSSFKKEMTGIYSTSINQSTLDECPMAYKSMKSIVDNIGDTARIDMIITPVYNFKAGDSDE